MPQPVPKDNQGFTLIEFLVAILILMVGLLGLLQVINVAMNSSRENKMRAEAINMADQLMATQRILPFAAVLSKNSSCFVKAGGISFGRYSINRVVGTGITGGTSTTTKSVTIGVAWRSKGKKQTHFLSSVIATQ